MIGAMIMYRFIIMGIFCDGWSFSQKAIVFFHGVLNDSGIVGAVAIVLTIVSLIPGLHPYKRRKGKRTALVIFLVLGFVLLVSNMVDLYFLKDFERRPTGLDWANIFYEKNDGIQFQKNFPFLGASIVIIVVLVTWWLILRWLHGVLGAFARADEKKLRQIWQGITVIVAGIFLLVAILNSDSIDPTGNILYNNGQSSFKYNAIQLGLTKAPIK